MTAAGLLVAEVVAANEDTIACNVILVFALTAVGAAVAWWLSGRIPAGDSHEAGCASCIDAAEPDDEDEDEDGSDDLMALADDVFATPPTPVNEPGISRWPGLDTAGPNAGAWFDDESRKSNQANARWITKMQQRKLGVVLVGETEQFLVAEAARRARQQSAADETWQRGEPGE